MDSFYPFKIRRTFAPSNNDKAIFEMLEQPRTPERRGEIKVYSVINYLKVV